MDADASVVNCETSPCIFSADPTSTAQAALVSSNIAALRWVTVSNEPTEEAMPRINALWSAVFDAISL
ncbi:MAG: hypothetical protein AAFY52_04820, partial [Pseudomonadota bacterium]